MVLEYCPGGELFYHLQKCQKFPEEVVVFYSSQVVLALEYLHSLNIIFRDLKPENVLIDCFGYAKLADFGLAKPGMTDSVLANTYCGTAEYLAPELLFKKGYGKSVDYWSLGCLIYEMVTGIPPFTFEGGVVDEMYDKIADCRIDLPSYLTPECCDLLKKLFVADPKERLKAAEIKVHPFYKKINWNNIENKRVYPPFVPNVKNVNKPPNINQEFLKLPVHSPKASTIDSSLASGME